MKMRTIFLRYVFKIMNKIYIRFLLLLKNKIKIEEKKHKKNTGKKREAYATQAIPRKAL